MEPVTEPDESYPELITMESEPTPVAPEDVSPPRTPSRKNGSLASFFRREKPDGKADSSKLAPERPASPLTYGSLNQKSSPDLRSLMASGKSFVGPAGLVQRSASSMSIPKMNRYRGHSSRVRAGVS